jgi:hypothetical protein
MKKMFIDGISNGLDEWVELGMSANFTSLRFQMLTITRLPGVGEVQRCLEGCMTDLQHQ